ncbi:MAG TPA: tetratricopeptide repeat protein, partial [Phenylobacterium sp.]|nr:tetratricopeptide repeat protein [Phenylobacterium sp.]
MDDAWAQAAAALSRDPGQPPTAYLQLARQLYQLRRYAEGERLAAEGLARHPQAHELWNIRGVFLRMLRRRPEALAALDRAIALRPGELGPRINRGNLLLDMGEGAGAATAFAELVAEAPGDALLHHHLGRALGAAGRPDAAAESFRKALAIRPERLETWRELAGLTD